MLVDMRGAVIGPDGKVQFSDDFSLAPAITLGASVYVETFSENFRTALDVTPYGPSRWIAHTPWYGDFGDAAFSDPQSGFPFQTGEAGLTITAKKDGTGQWRAGLLSSLDPQGRGFAQAMGYFEARMKMPAGPGVWPAFWLHANGDDLYSAELDVVEYYGKFNSAYVVTSHVWPKSQANQHTYQQQIVQCTTNLSDGYHLYGVEITDGLVSYYFDRVQVFSHPAAAEHKMPMSILLNLALGGGWPIDGTPDPSVLSVDYVKVYRRG